MQGTTFRAALLGLGLVATAAMAHSDARASTHHHDQPLPHVSGTCGALVVVAPGPTPLCTHGPDPAPDGVDTSKGWVPGTAYSSPPHEEAPTVSAPAQSSPPNEQPPAVTANAPGIPCFGDGVSGNRVQAVYARTSDRPDRFAQVVGPIRQWAAELNGVIGSSAARTGGQRYVRFVTDGSCQLDVQRVELTTAGDDSIATTVAEFQAKGLNRPDRKYLVWMDSTVLCGVATYFLDDRFGQDNVNNGNSAGRAPTVARVDSGCWGLASRGESIEAHELVHSLGAVQKTAPHATSLGHCTDDSDRMCYADGSPEVVITVCQASMEALLDCNSDDYFHTAPPPVNYLASHWNTASSSFLSAQAPTATGTPPPPTPTTMPPAPPPPPPAPPEPAKDTIARIAGNDRVATSVVASRSGFVPGQATAAVLANSASFADALPATPLAAAKKGPLLLTGAAQLDSRIADELRRVLPSGATVYLVGGDAVLSPAVATSIESLGYRVMRLSGANRYATAAAIAQQGLNNPSTLFEVTGRDFADALAGGAAASAASAAILLTDGSTQSTETAQYLAMHPTARRIAIGGAAAAADPTAEPLAGRDRYETAAQIAARFFAGSVPFVGVASGRSFPDGLSGGAHIATRAGPVLLVPPASQLPPAVTNYLRARAGAIRGGWVYGGTTALPESTRTAVQQAIT